MTERPHVLEDGSEAAGLCHGDLWFRNFELGGIRTALEVEAYLYGALMATTDDRDLVA